MIISKGILLTYCTSNPLLATTLLNHEQLFDVNQNLLAGAAKKFTILYSFFQLTRLSLHRAMKEFLAFIKATVYDFIISIRCALFNVY